MSYDDGHLDAMARKTASSEDPAYKLGYLDGVFERASLVVEAAVRERTVGGLLFEVVPKSAVIDGEGVVYAVHDHEGRMLSRGEAVDVEHGVAACEAIAVHMGQPSARMSQIKETIRRLNTTMDEDEVDRIAERTASYLLERVS